MLPNLRDDFVAPIPEAERADMILAYHAQLNSADDEVRIRAAKAWSKYEYEPSSVHMPVLWYHLTIRMATSRLYVDPEYLARAEGDEFAKFVVIEATAHDLLNLQAFSVHSPVSRITTSLTK